MKRVLGLFLAALVLAGCASVPVNTKATITGVSGSINIGNDKLTVPPVQTQEVLIPVAKGCQTDLARPQYPDTDEALKNLPFPLALQNLKKNPKDLTARSHVEANVYYLSRLMVAGRVVRSAYIDQLETALQGCK